VRGDSRHWIGNEVTVRLRGRKSNGSIPGEMKPVARSSELIREVIGVGHKTEGTKGERFGGRWYLSKELRNGVSLASEKGGGGPKSVRELFRELPEKGKVLRKTNVIGCQGGRGQVPQTRSCQILLFELGRRRPLAEGEEAGRIGGHGEPIARKNEKGIKIERV